MNLVILGPQGSGKGTQARLLEKKFNLVHIDMGLQLRLEALKKTALGRKIYELVYKKKVLLPDNIMEKVLARKLKSIPKNKGVVLDGSPRRIDQINLVEQAMFESGRKLDKVIYIKVPEKESIKRISRRYHCYHCSRHYVLGEDINSSREKCISCGGKIVRRKDDTAAGVRKRLAIFRKETLPVIRHYRKKNKVVEVSGMGKIDDVSERIIKGIKNHK
jgi:adenylate kinase